MRLASTPMASVAFCLAALVGAPSAAQNGAPTITSSSNLSVYEGTVPVASLTATDPEDHPLTWTLADSAGADGALFTLSSTGDLAFLATPDYEDPADADGNGVYEVRVQVSDGTNATTGDLRVTVVDLAPGLTGPAAASHPEGKRGLRLAAYEANDDVAWSLTGADAASFTIADGLLRFADPPDHESPADQGADSVYDVTVNAGDGTNTETRTVAVTVTDRSEPGFVSLSPLRPRLGQAVTAALSDPDTPTGVAWVWERSTGPGAWETIEGEVAAVYTPGAADSDRYLRATASYSDNHGADQSASATGSHVVFAYALSRLSLTTSGGGRRMYPSFDPEVLHYAAECATGRWTLAVSKQDPDARLAVDGRQLETDGRVELSGLDGQHDIRISLTGPGGAATTYFVHCFDQDLPDISTNKTAGATGGFEDLLAFTEVAFPGRGIAGYLILADNNGVPRVRKRIPGSVTSFHRIFDDAPHPYVVSVPSNVSGAGYLFRTLDEDFKLTSQRIQTVAPLTHTAPHDAIARPNGDWVLLSFNPADRDASFLTEDYGIRQKGGEAWGPVRVRDSAIQIRTSDGTALFTWNSWGAMAIEDCLGDNFPGD